MNFSTGKLRNRGSDGNQERVNPFLRCSGPSSHNNMNMFYKPQQEDGEEGEGEREGEEMRESRGNGNNGNNGNGKKAADEEFPSLVSAPRATTATSATSATTATTASYKALLVTGSNARMLEEQSKMRSAQAAELERKTELYNEELISSARAARAALANDNAETDLEMSYTKYQNN